MRWRASNCHITAGKMVVLPCKVVTRPLHAWAPDPIVAHPRSRSAIGRGLACRSILIRCWGCEHLTGCRCRPVFVQVMPTPAHAATPARPCARRLRVAEPPWRPPGPPGPPRTQSRQTGRIARAGSTAHEKNCRLHSQCRGSQITMGSTFDQSVTQSSPKTGTWCGLTQPSAPQGAGPEVPFTNVAFDCMPHATYLK